MGEKNIEIKSATLYLNNEPIMELDKEFVCASTIDTTNMPKILNSESMEGGFEVSIDRNSMLSLLLGRPVTNNWLKNHGGVMTKKRGRK